MIRMPIWLTILSVILVGLFNSPAAAFKRVQVGDTVGDFPFRPLGQGTISFSETVGQKATLILFWATWSPRSIEALSDFQMLFAEHGPRELQVIALNVDTQDMDEETRKEVESTISRLGITYPVALDEELVLFDRFGVVAVPSVVLSSSDRSVVSILDGYAHTTRSEFREEVLGLLVAPPPTEDERPDQIASYTPKGTSLRYYQMGKLLWQKGMRNQAIKALTRSVAEDPNHLEACRALAEALRSAGDVLEAEEIDHQLARLQDFCVLRRVEVGTKP